ncbi:hypothetical protein CYB_0219 [Synechococcus sp. JA-2-3B'a(2-13)]|nr:hypothetical protein CYB_0219 [Synechococcus sp. JA-2-3B'a(2-13)]
MVAVYGQAKPQLALQGSRLQAVARGLDLPLAW